MYSAEEQNEFYNNRPGKPVDGVAVLYDQSGKVLIAKPNYKTGWCIIGGSSEPQESPLQGMLRETREEIGLDLPAERFSLLGMRYIPTRDGRNEYVQVYFAATLTPDEIAHIKLEPEELEDFKFVTLNELANYTNTPRMQALQAMVQNKGGYLEAETKLVDPQVLKCE